MSDEERQAAAQEKIADMIFGPVPTEEAEPEVEAEPEIEAVDTEPVEEEVTEEEFEEVEFEGMVYEVPKPLKDALLRQSDYTQKTQTLADQRREVELQQKQIETVRKEQEFIRSVQPEVSNIQWMKATIQQMEQDLQQNLSSLSSEQLFKKKIEVDGYKEQLNALSQGLEQKYSEFEEAQKQSYQELLEQGAQVLKQAIPDWNEDKQKEMRDYALSQGFSQQEVASVVDPRHVQVLWQASQYEKIQKEATPAAAKVATAIKTKARSRKQTENDRKLALRNKLKSSKLSNQQKADLVGQTIAEKFGM